MLPSNQQKEKNTIKTPKTIKIKDIKNQYISTQQMITHRKVIDFFLIPSAIYFTDPFL